MPRINASLSQSSGGASGAKTPAVIGGTPGDAATPFQTVLRTVQKQTDGRQASDRQAAPALTQKPPDQKESRESTEQATAPSTQPQGAADKSQTPEPVQPRGTHSIRAQRDDQDGKAAAADAKAKPSSEQLTQAGPPPVDEKNSNQQRNSSGGKNDPKPAKPAAPKDAAAFTALPAVAAQPPAQSPVSTVVTPESTGAAASRPASRQGGRAGLAAAKNPAEIRSAGKVSGAASSTATSAQSHRNEPAAPVANNRAVANDRAVATDPAVAIDPAVAAAAQAALAQTASAAVSPALAANDSAAPIAASPPVAPAHAALSAAAALAPTSPEAAFAATNHPPIVMGVHGQLLPDGGTMNIRLAPPELGDLQVSVQVTAGAVAASFQTSNDQATRLLSHSLGQLKSALENAGVSVARLQVSQMPPTTSRQDANANGGGKGNPSRDDQTQPDGQAGARDQQRRELLRRMWKKVSGGDDLDLVA
jgi:flagellar hook-length control protein FliK